MKGRFTTLDLLHQLKELRSTLVGMRVQQIYDCDHKTYLLRLNKPEKKTMLLIESGARLHTTQFEWPKAAAPSGFSMKLRKHITNKRLESIRLVGVDRVVDLQFGSGDAAYHVLLELYDRGNVVLTDHEYQIMNILRPRVQGEDKFLVHKNYPVELAKQSFDTMTSERLAALVQKAKPGDTLKKMCMSAFEFGPALLEHMFLKAGLTGNMKFGRDFNPEDASSMSALLSVFQNTGEWTDVKDEDEKEETDKTPFKGYIVQNRGVRPKPGGSEGEEEEFFTYVEFHPVLLEQHKSKPVKEFDSFDRAIDEFFSKIEGQKIEVKAVQQEKMALKKLDNVRKDHEVRVEKLQVEQELNHRKGELIEMNEALVENALQVIRSALANQLDWKQIQDLVEEATANNDPVAKRIKKLKFEINHLAILLTDPYAHIDEARPNLEQIDEEEEEEEEDSEKVVPDKKKNKKKSQQQPKPSKDSVELVVDIDLDLSARANARKYFTQKKSAGVKERKTLESQTVALKSAERRTKQTLKEVAAITNIIKARKVFWFEKFFWFVSSENYLVIAGRDLQQNELIVKRYMRPGDLYVHADLHGAASVVIKNPSGRPVPPKTLNEAGLMAVCYSVAWTSHVMAAAYWVESHQVTKTAQTGEYLPAGSFMIRGKKNPLVPAQMVLGFGFMFKLEDGSIARHKNDRIVRLPGAEGEEEEDVKAEGEGQDVSKAMEALTTKSQDDGDEEEIDVEDSPSSSDKEASEGSEKVKKEEDEEEGKEKKENTSDEGEEEEEEKSAFPDTAIDIKYSSSGEVKFKARGLSESSDPKEEEIVFAQSMPTRQKQTQGKSNRRRKEEEEERKRKVLEEEREQQRKNNNNGNNNQNVRGKKGKLKKMKEKYKDQDDEDREMMMYVLQGSSKESKKKGKKKGGRENEDDKTNDNKPKPKPQQQKKQEPKPVGEGCAPGVASAASATSAALDPAEEERVAGISTELDMLDSLTGVPVAEDELLFAVPVVAPYNTMTNYKYKVKVTPGGDKRGKATKTALHIFLNDRATSQREKDLLKSVKSEDLARYLPGNVKMSAPNLQKIQKMRKKNNKKTGGGNPSVS